MVPEEETQARAGAGSRPAQRGDGRYVETGVTPAAGVHAPHISGGLACVTPRIHASAAVGAVRQRNGSGAACRAGLHACRASCIEWN